MNTIDKPVNAGTHFDEPVTPAALAQAIERGKLRRLCGIHAHKVSYLSAQKSLLIGFADHTAIVLPVQNYPELAPLSLSDLRQLTLGLGGSALCLDKHNMHISIAGLVQASGSLMEMATSVIASHNGRRSSAAKVRAARANGNKGGRPRKVAEAA